MSPRAKWKRVRVETIDRVLATNGAHAAPARYELLTDGGQCLATIQFMSGTWHWSTNAGARGKAFAVMAAKHAAKAAVRA